MLHNTGRAKGWMATTLCCSILLLSACSDQSSQNAQQQGQAQQQPPTKVDVVTLKPTNLEVKEQVSGRVVAFLTAEIRPQVGGIIEERLFDEGTVVNEGDVLYQIDDATYEADLASAKADLAVANANASSVKQKAERYRNLVKQAAVSKQDAIDAESEWKQAEAQILAARAAVKQAQINLDYTKITSPISGVISRSSVTKGALVTAQQTTALATVRQMSPIYVDIQRPATDMLKARKSGGAEVPVLITLEDGTQYSEQGVLKFSETSVDETTGMVTARAEFPNADGLLVPGMYVRATLITETIENALSVPQKGITRQRDGSTTALVVGSNNAVESRTVEVGEAIGDQWLVKSGLKEGDRVIVAGLQKVKAGATVEPVDSAATTAQANQ
jgi:membrane fusion protein (multidrug efflux system)